MSRSDKAQAKAMERERAKAVREMARRELAAIRAALTEARASRRGSMKHARAICVAGRKHARERARRAKAEMLRKLADELERDMNAARSTCDAALGNARTLATKHEQARAKLQAERAFRAEMKRLASHDKQRRKEASSKRQAIHAIQQSDDEVRGNISPELVALWERVKGRIRGSRDMSRTEAFLHYAEEHPDEILSSLDDVTDRLVRELEERERGARRRMSSRYEPREEAPF